MFGTKTTSTFPKDDLPTACSELDKIIRQESEKQGIDLNNLEPTMDLNGKRKNNIYTRYLLARNFRIEDCKNMVLNSLKWRFAMQPYFVSPEDVEGVLKRDYVFFHGKDNEENSIIWVSVQNHLDYTNMLPVYQKFVLFMMEEGLRRASQVLDEYDLLREEDILQGREPRPYPVPKATLVFDMRGFSLANMDYALVKFLAETLQAHYPEVLAHTYIVDSPWIFSTCWNVVKGWLDPVVVSKIQFVSRMQLLQNINVDKVPVMCGGTSIHVKMGEAKDTVGVVGEAKGSVGVQKEIMKEAKDIVKEAKNLMEEANDLQEKAKDSKEEVKDMENKIKNMEEEVKEIQEVVKNIQMEVKIIDKEEKLLEEEEKKLEKEKK